MAYLSEAIVEELVLDQLRDLGYMVASESDIGPDGKAPERESYSDVLLAKRLAAAIEKLNPAIPSVVQRDALRKIRATDKPSLVEENRRLHKMMVEGVDVEYYDEDGTIRGDKVRLIDFEDVAANEWIATGQFTVIEGRNNRRADVVVFVNGLPLGVIELKAPGGQNATLEGAHNQLQTYKAQIPSLFRTNALLVTSDGLTARVGSLTADRERFMPWRTTDGNVIAAKGQPELNILLAGIFDKRRLLDLLRDFTVFGESDSGLAKIIAGYHQFHAVRHAVEKTVQASAPEGNHKIGVIWHTQGSGKSLLMAF
jgi:type I restriction enzyme, R subunit